MYRSINTQLISPFEQAESSHKDIVIATLKKELYQLKDLQTDYIRLNQEIAKLESKYAMLLEEKDRNDKQHRTKLEINKKQILELRADVDNLKVQIHKATVEIQETLRENTTLKRMCDNRSVQISAIMNDNRTLQKDNDFKRQENKNLTFNIKTLKEEKLKLQGQYDRLSHLLDTNIAALKQAEKQARNLQATNTKLDNTLAQAERDNQKLVQQLKAREVSTVKTQGHLKQLTEKSDDLEGKTKQLQLQLSKLEQEYAAVSATVDNQINKNKDLSSKLKSLDNTIRVTQTELDQSLIKRQNLTRQHYDLVADNRTLNSQIDNCLMNILEYEKLNADLQKQVENYIETDQHARTLLNRRDNMKNILDEVNTKLGKTSGQIAHLR